MAVDLHSALIKTAVIRPGMLVRDVFIECGRAHVQSLPYVDESGKLTGRLTLKNIMKFSCLPEYMVELADLLGNQMSCVDNAELKAQQVICSPVEPHVRELGDTIPSAEPLIKALAVMERNDTSYIFVVDDGIYKGTVTIQGIAHQMTASGEC
jgi:hypothetical protein